MAGNGYAMSDHGPMRVHVYWNFNRRVWSVRSAEGPTRGRVVAYCETVALRDCTMVVQPAGVKKARETGVKNVHAYIRGFWVGQSEIDDALASPITYNPFREAQFIWRETREVIERAAACIFQITSEEGPWCEACVSRS